MRTKSTLPFNLLTAALLGLSAPVAMATAWIFAHPRSRLNPFPPPTPPATATFPQTAAGAPSPTSAFPTLPPQWTATLTPPPTSTRTPTPTRTATPTSTPTPTLPPEARIADISGQRQALPLSCESRSAVDWAAYFGVHLDELDFLRLLPRSDNPDIGFVGDV